MRTSVPTTGAIWPRTSRERGSWKCRARIICITSADTSFATGTERLEIEANQFAAALLMPGDILDDLLKASPIDVEDEGSIEEWAKKFLVSKAALQYRIRNL